MQTLPMELPKCDKPGHGYMVLRPKERQTPEQLWCGVWYDCQKCTGGTLFPSRELLEQNARLAPPN